MPGAPSDEGAGAASAGAVEAGAASAGARTPSVPAPADLLVFDEVSYSYEPSARERGRRARRAGAGRRRAKWGGAPDAVWALDGVSLSVRAGEFLGVAGHTGSGKSTLIQHMNGLLHPQRGRVLLDGRDLADKRVAAEAKARVGVVFQYPEYQLFASSVYEDVAFGPRNLGLDGRRGRRPRARGPGARRARFRGGSPQEPLRALRRPAAARRVRRRARHAPGGARARRAGGGPRSGRAPGRSSRSLRACTPRGSPW